MARAMFLQLGTSDKCTRLGVVLGKQVLGPPRQTQAVREIPGVQFTSFLQQKAPQPESRGALFPVRLSLCACPCPVLEPCEQATAAASRVGWGLITLSPGSPFGLSFTPLSSFRQCGRSNGELSQRTPDGVAGVSAAAVRAPGHHRVRRGGGRGVSEAAGTEQTFLLSSQPVAWGRALALM